MSVLDIPYLPAYTRFGPGGEIIAVGPHDLGLTQYLLASPATQPTTIAQLTQHLNEIYAAMIPTLEMVHMGNKFFTTTMAVLFGHYLPANIQTPNCAWKQLVYTYYHIRHAPPPEQQSERTEYFLRNGITVQSNFTMIFVDKDSKLFEFFLSTMRNPANFDLEGLSARELRFLARDASYYYGAESPWTAILNETIDKKTSNF